MRKVGALWGIVAVSVVSAAIDGWCDAVGFRQGALFILVPMVLYLILIFQWLSVDSPEHNYTRSQALNVGIVFFAMAALPVYLYKSRQPGARAKAIGLYMALLVGLLGLEFGITYGVYAAIAL
jgi:hypothetical protein